MAINFVQDGKVLTLTAPAGGLLSGQGVLVGAIFGVSQNTVAAGAPAEIGVVGVWSLPKAASPIVFAAGAPVFWDKTNNVCTSVSLAHYPIGVATVAAAASDVSVTVRLDGVSTGASAT
ncbi:MAG: DUF2190 family protein [Methylocella sp.]